MTSYVNTYTTPFLSRSARNTLLPSMLKSPSEMVESKRVSLMAKTSNFLSRGINHISSRCFTRLATLSMVILKPLVLDTSKHV